MVQNDVLCHMAHSSLSKFLVFEEICSSQLIELRVLAMIWFGLRADTVVKEIELKTANKGGLARALLARAERADHGCSRSGASDM